jgi:sugar O-acyltransferase (sialic acid O-acetyltransferase NeuD family)
MRYLVIGAAGHAQEVAWSLREQSERRGEPSDLVFFDDALSPGPLPSGLGSIVGGLDSIASHAHQGESQLVLGIGLPRTKFAVVNRLQNLRLRWTTVIHPAATIGPNVCVDEGSYVAAGAILTVNARIGRFATINTHCAVAHEAVVGAFATLHPNAHVAGGVSIGEGCELGAAAVVIQGITIGPWAVLGASCTAIAPLAGGRTYVGTPARDVQDKAAATIRHAR